ncbi:MAG TPA: DUF1622 domain-containing protein, partial [Ktedonobacterales bacterium]|nr:DUF1622 domain-containing protein [Ktedonobacterales bacterium]
EAGGLLALTIGTVVAIYSYVRALRTPPEQHSGAYRGLRQGLGRAILIGLELLIAGDIIRTVTIQPTIENVLVLGLIVLVRTFLSWSLEVEINGQWPWRRAQTQSGQSGRALAEDEL